jgi:ketosteroid isomerase-like protein
MIARTTVIAVLALVALAGCGGEQGTEGQARTAVNRYLAALAAKDGKRVCATYSEDYRGLVERESGKPCAQAGLGSPGRFAFKGVMVDGNDATATISCDDPTAGDCSLKLVFEHGDWKIDGSPSPND